MHLKVVGKMSKYSFFRIERIWNSKCLSDANVDHAFRFVKAILGIIQPGPLYKYTSHSCTHLERKHLEKISNITQNNLEYYMTPGFDFISVYFGCRVFQSLRPDLEVLILEGWCPSEKRMAYFNVAVGDISRRYQLAFDHNRYPMHRWIETMDPKYSIPIIELENIRLFDPG